MSAIKKALLQADVDYQEALTFYMMQELRARDNPHEMEKVQAAYKRKHDVFRKAQLVKAALKELEALDVPQN